MFKNLFVIFKEKCTEPAPDEISYLHNLDLVVNRNMFNGSQFQAILIVTGLCQNIFIYSCFVVVVVETPSQPHKKFQFTIKVQLHINYHGCNVICDTVKHNIHRNSHKVNCIFIHVFHRLCLKYMKLRIVGISCLVLQTTF